MAHAPQIVHFVRGWHISFIQPYPYCSSFIAFTIDLSATACKCRMCQNSFRGTNCGTWQIASPTSSEFTTSALCIYCSFLSHVVCSERGHLLKHPLTGIWYRMAFAFFVKRIQRLTNEGMTNLTRKCCFSKHGFLYVQHCNSLEVVY